jgi:hypothetical protein
LIGSYPAASLSSAGTRAVSRANLFRVGVDLKVPGSEIVVGRDPSAHHAHEDVHVAIRDAFASGKTFSPDLMRTGSVEIPQAFPAPRHDPAGLVLAQASHRAFGAATAAFVTTDFPASFSQGAGW